MKGTFNVEVGITLHDVANAAVPLAYDVDKDRISTWHIEQLDKAAEILREKLGVTKKDEPSATMKQLVERFVTMYNFNAHGNYPSQVGEAGYDNLLKVCDTLHILFKEVYGAEWGKKFGLYPHDVPRKYKVVDVDKYGNEIDLALDPTYSEIPNEKALYRTLGDKYTVFDTFEEAQAAITMSEAYVKRTGKSGLWLLPMKIVEVE